MPAMAKRCYYEVLGVERDCERSRHEGRVPQARHAAPSRPQSRRQGLRAPFKEINEAYDVLKDGDKRAAYDRFGHAAFEQGMGGGAHGFGADFGSAFSDIFEGIFGMGGARQRSSGRERGADLRYNMEITLEEAFHGKTAQVRLPTSVTCEACSGTGAKTGTKPKTCQHCNGHGRIRHTQGGFFTLERTCPVCQGRGQVIEDPCPSCSGLGPRHARAHAVGQHSARRRGRHPHPARRRRRGRRARRAAGRPLYFPVACRARVLPARRRRPALPGADLDGDGGAGRRIRGADDRRQQGAGEGAGGTQSGRRFRLAGKGMPVLRSKQTGDMYVQVVVETPQNLTKRQRELLAEFEKLSSQDTQPESSGFFAQGQGLLRQQCPLGPACAIGLEPA